MAKAASKAGEPLAPTHPGLFVKAELAKKGINVTNAAKLIGISRPGVSSFLNARVAATPEMASRIESALGIPAQQLLDLQAAFDAARMKGSGVSASVRAFVPTFLSIKANQIEDWAAKSISARTRLSVLLRILVHSTGRGLTKVDFPGNDDAQRPGWDGLIHADEGTPWIPQGISGWEFGTDKNIKEKADSDFAKSVKALSKSDRSDTTFVFVTPRRWPAKDKWAADMEAKGHWKGVRAYDCSDLEQWLEQSLPGQVWFANETSVPSESVRALDRCWDDFANVTDPVLPADLFRSAIDASKRVMASRLTKTPDGPTIVCADSVEEALAFFSQLFGPRGGGELAAMRDRVLVFDKPGVLPRLAQGSRNFIPVAFSREVERELAPFVKSLQAIVVYPRSGSMSEPHVTLEPSGYENFEKALESIGIERDKRSQLASASGRSLTVLRRQLARVDAVRMPEWAADEKTAASLLPFLFVGTWNSNNPTDCEGLSLLAEQPYDALEKEAQRLAGINDAPLWSLGSVRGVKSKIDLLFAVARSIGKDDLVRYFSLARMVLGEDNPALDLPEEDRWAASLHGKSREFSAAFRDGISETLVLLAVHGNNLLKSRLTFDLQYEVERVVRDLLLPLTLRKLEANDRDLPTYAEAAPEAFLSIIKQDLESNNPAVLGLLKPANSGVFGSNSSRTGLLWALEGLAWNPDTLTRAALILARLSQIEINDNLVNKPTHSLASIFRVWMPQTAVDHGGRLEVMRRLEGQYPDVAWKICTAQFGVHHQVGDYSYKPRWRPDGYGFGEPFSTWPPIISFQKEMVEMALHWKHGYSKEMLCDLIERLPDLDDNSRAKVWELIRGWAPTSGDSEKAIVREKIRTTLFSRRGRRRKGSDEGVSLNEAGRAAYDALEPTSLIDKNSWLFRDTWVEESADEIAEEDFDYEKREARIEQLRIGALKEILSRHGSNGVFELAQRGKASFQIGWLLAQSLLSDDELVDFLAETTRRLLQDDQSFSLKNLVAGSVLATRDESKRERLLRGVQSRFSAAEFVQVLLLSPFCGSTWRLVDGLQEAERVQYWQTVHPQWIHDSDSEATEAINRLLDAGRPSAAFQCFHLRPERVEASLVFRVLTEIGKGGAAEQPGQYRLEQYHLDQAFRHIDKSPSISLQDKAMLEFGYIEVLARPWSKQESYGIPNLERYVEANPDAFVHAIIWAYKRKNGGEDPVEWRVSPENRSLATRGYRLLDGLSRIPGHNDLGELTADRLGKWVATVRQLCADLDRAAIGDVCIGKLLAEAPVGGDGVWPCEPVRQVMEELQSDDISSGAHTGLYNSRGAHWRGEGGDQEREIAAKYQKWADALRYSHPFVSSNLLMGLVKSYTRDAEGQDIEAGIRRRRLR